MTSSQRPPGSTWRDLRFWVPVLVVLPAVAFGPCLTADFVDWDDPHYVLDRAEVRSGLTARSFAWSLTALEYHNWHPLTWISYQIDVSLFGRSATGFHLTNLLLHAANGLLVFRFLRAATGDTLRSGAAALLFAVHPLRTEVVAWISERKELLCVFWGTWALILWLRFRRDGRPSSWLASFAAFALALSSKQMVVTLPCLLVVFECLGFGIPQEDRRSRWRRCAWTAPFFLLAAGASAAAVLAQGDAVSGAHELPLGARSANALASYGVYLRQFVLPWRLLPFYDHPGGTIEWLRAAASAGLLVAATCLAWRLRRSPAVPVGWLWYLGTLVPVIGIVQIGGQAHADRYTYFPMIGLSMSVAWLPWERLPRAVPRVPTAAVLVLALVVLSFRQTLAWSDSRTLWRHTLDVDPTNSRAALNYSRILLQDRRFSEAAELLARSDRLHTLPEAWHNLGMAWTGLEDYERSVASYRRSLELDSGHVASRANLGNLLRATGRVDEAVEQLSLVVAARPTSGAAHFNLGLAQRDARNAFAAARSFRKATELGDPAVRQAAERALATLPAGGAP